MALKIRLRRMGRKKAPTYRIVVAETTMPRDGRFVATIGHYNPRTEPLTLVVDRDKALYWLDQGASPTDTTKSLLKRAGVFGPAPTVTETVVANVREAAKKAGGKVRGAGAAVADAVGDAAEDVRDAVEDVVEDVREAVEDLRERARGKRDEEPAAEAEPNAEAEAEAEAEEPAAEAEPNAEAEAEEPAAEETKAAPAAE